MEECKIAHAELNLVHEANHETTEFSNALDTTQKCKLKIEIITHASNEEWKYNTIAKQLLNIFDLKDKSNIGGLITSITSTYVPSFIIM